MSDKERELPDKNREETPNHFGSLNVKNLAIEGNDPMVKLKLQYPSPSAEVMLKPLGSDSSQLLPSLDLLPGDPGWTPKPQPDCYETPEKFTAAWEALKAEEPDIETRMRRVRRDYPLASEELMHRRIGPGSQVPWSVRKKRF